MRAAATALAEANKEAEAQAKTEEVLARRA